MGESLTPSLTREQFRQSYLSYIMKENTVNLMNLAANQTFALDGQTLGVAFEQSPTVAALPREQKLAILALKMQGYLSQPDITLRKLPTNQLDLLYVGIDQIKELMSKGGKLPMDGFIFQQYMSQMLNAAKDAAGFKSAFVTSAPEAGQMPSDNPFLDGFTQVDPYESATGATQSSMVNHLGDRTDGSTIATSTMGDQSTQTTNEFTGNASGHSRTHNAYDGDMSSSASRSYGQFSGLDSSTFQSSDTDDDDGDSDMYGRRRMPAAPPGSVASQRSNLYYHTDGSSSYGTAQDGRASEFTDSDATGPLYPGARTRRSNRSGGTRGLYDSSTSGSSRSGSRRSGNINDQFFEAYRYLISTGGFTQNELNVMNPGEVIEMATRAARNRNEEDLYGRPAQQRGSVSSSDRGSSGTSNLYGGRQGSRNIPDDASVSSLSTGFGLKSALQQQRRTGKRGPRGRIILGEGLCPFGKHMLDVHDLDNNGTVSIRYEGGKLVRGIPRKAVGGSVAGALKAITKGKNPSAKDVDAMTEEERNYLNLISSKSGIKDLQVPSKDKTSEEKLMHKFETMKGEIIAGNDNKDLIKEFKLMLIQLKQKHKISASDANEVLLDLASLGY